jgi:hypothetical protein
MSRRRQRRRDGRQQISQRLADDVSHLGPDAHRLAQEPHAVADVPGLVVVDLRVTLNESRQQALTRQVVGR